MIFAFLFGLLSPQFRQRLVRWLEENRGLVIVVFCLPASFLFDCGLKLRNWLFRTFLSAPDKHDDRVKAIQKRVEKWSRLPASSRPLMCTSRPNWLSLSTTFFRKDLCHRIPIPLYDILGLDEARQVVRVEPTVSVADITRYLIPKGYTLAVTLEIGDATLGGLAFGVGMTTYSHKVGLYQETIVSYDVILGDGRLVHVTADNEYKDLFYCLPWSHGSLGFLVALELKVIPVKPFLRLRYIPVHTKDEYCQQMRELSGALDSTKTTPDYLEATIFNKHEAVIMVGYFADVDTPDKTSKVNEVTKWYKPWFYKHVESILHSGVIEHIEYIPLREYLLRHNRAIFWVLESMIPFGNNPLFRFFLGWLCPPKPAFLKFTTTPGVRAMTFTKQVFQDIVLPMTVLEKSIDLSEELFDTYPVLIYPCRIYDHGKQGQLRPPREDQRCPGTDWGMFYDLGVYGTPGPVRRREKYDAVYAMRTMEKFIRESGGYSFLYADIFMNREEFEEMFDLTSYEAVRKKYAAEGAFPHLYDKVKPEVDVFQIGKEYAEQGDDVPNGSHFKNQ